jgi:hypothetical protein
MRHSCEGRNLGSIGAVLKRFRSPIGVEDDVPSPEWRIKFGFVGCNNRRALHLLDQIRCNARWLLHPTDLRVCILNIQMIENN